MTWHIGTADTFTDLILGMPILDMRQDPDWKQSLALMNPVPSHTGIVLHPESVALLWALHNGLPTLTPRQRQLLALLMNHSAVVRWHQDERVFGEPEHAYFHGADLFGVGTHRPLLWVLGEQGNSRAKTHPMPFGTAAGHAMLWPHVNPWYVRVSNVLQPQERPAEARRRIRHDWQRLGQPPVLLLGNTAASLWAGHGEVLGYLEHPQHVYRFHHTKCAEWSHQFVQLQREALGSKEAVW